MQKLFYKIRKFLGLTLMEDIVNSTTEEEIKNFKKPSEDKEHDWVTPSSFVGQ